MGSSSMRDEIVFTIISSLDLQFICRKQGEKQRWTTIIKMEEETNKRETRRSRSKTPSTLRLSVDRDAASDGEKNKKIKKNPVVEWVNLFLKIFIEYKKNENLRFECLQNNYRREGVSGGASASTTFSTYETQCCQSHNFRLLVGRFNWIGPCEQGDGRLDCELHSRRTIGIDCLRTSNDRNENNYGHHKKIGEGLRRTSRSIEIGCRCHIVDHKDDTSIKPWGRPKRIECAAGEEFEIANKYAASSECCR